ncbi:MAG: UDP-N-acetylmuramate dehydrogenase [Chloroflexi bacterium]|nr:UDP-N-acetylmuramate dehydrogenase [Chloroflexota bacterium]
MNEELIEALSDIAEVRLDEPLSRHATFGVGGPADVYVIARTEDELRLAYAKARAHEAATFIYGSGSNVLVGDGGIRGVTIENRTSEVEGPAQNGAGYKVRVASGVSFATLARRMASAGYGGIEWACGIPGSLGGAVVSNAGAYDRSLKDVLKSVRTGDADGNVATVPTDDLHLEYRRSAFTEGALADIVLLSADLHVDEADPSELRARIEEFDADRKASQPPGRNCGSVFKNPPDHPSWWYVDQVGLRSHRIGNAQFSELHTNFILNLGDATARDIVQLIELAEARIKEQFDIDLEREVALIGEFE